MTAEARPNQFAGLPEESLIRMYGDSYYNTRNIRVVAETQLILLALTDQAARVLEEMPEDLRSEQLKFQADRLISACPYVYREDARAKFYFQMTLSALRRKQSE